MKTADLIKGLKTNTRRHHAEMRKIQRDREELPAPDGGGDRFDDAQGFLRHGRMTPRTLANNLRAQAKGILNPALARMLMAEAADQIDRLATAR